jgi:hypothetical protein
MDQALIGSSIAERLKLANEYAELDRIQEAEAIFTNIVAARICQACAAG